MIIIIIKLWLQMQMICIVNRHFVLKILIESLAFSLQNLFIHSFIFISIMSSVLSFIYLFISKNYYFYSSSHSQQFQVFFCQIIYNQLSVHQQQQKKKLNKTQLNQAQVQQLKQIQLELLENQLQLESQQPLNLKQLVPTLHMLLYLFILLFI